MAFNVFYSMVKEYAEELVKKNVNFVPTEEAKLCALLTSSHDIIAGVTSFSLYNGSLSAIPAEYMAAVAMNNIGQTKVLRMITLSLADFSVVTPTPSELDIINSFDPENMKCEVFISATESVLVASLMGVDISAPAAVEVPVAQAAPAAETVQRQAVETASAPQPEVAAPVINTAETVSKVEKAAEVPAVSEITAEEDAFEDDASAEKALEQAMESFMGAVEEAIASKEAAKEESIPEAEESVREDSPVHSETLKEADVSESGSEASKENAKSYMDELSSSEASMMEALNNLARSTSPKEAEQKPVREEVKPAARNVPVQDKKETAAESPKAEKEVKPVEEKKDTPIAAAPSGPKGAVPNFFGGFGDDDESGVPEVDAAELEKMGFITNTAPKIAPVQLEKPKTEMTASAPQFSKGVDIDENNPFYDANDPDSADNKVVYFAEMNKDENKDGAASGNSQEAQKKGEELSMDEMLKQAKKRKKIAKANFNFRKK